MDRTAIVFPIRFAWGGTAVQTTTRELSLSGVLVRCLVTPPPAGTAIRLKLYLPGSPLENEVSAVVRERLDSGFWAEFVGLATSERSRIDELLRRRARRDDALPIGAVALQPAPVEDSRRTFPRYNARFAVRFATVQDFVLEYAANISAGGVFVVTNDPPEMDAIVRVMMELPGGGPSVEAKAVVVHRVTPAEAKERSTAAGVGVQFVDADDLFRERIDRAIESILKLEKNA